MVPHFLFLKEREYREGREGIDILRQEEAVPPILRSADPARTGQPLRASVIRRRAVWIIFLGEFSIEIFFHKDIVDVGEAFKQLFAPGAA